MKKLTTNKKYFTILFSTVMLFVCANFANAQPTLPPRIMTVAATQAIHFGTFWTNTLGGTVTVGWDGNRTSTGGITLLTIEPTAQPAIFEIKLCPGRRAIVTFDATTELTGTNGGPSLTLDLGPTENGISGTSITTNYDCDFITPLRMGGTLHVPGNAIPGTFTGSFYITINQE